MTDVERTDPAAEDPPEVLPREMVNLDDLTPHPRNYRHHPQDQIDHLVASIRQSGFYKNVVITRDGTILAGHGACIAARKAGLTAVPATRLDVDPDSPAALKIVAGDNELGRFAEVDDRILTEILKEIAEAPDLGGLFGTGYDEMMLANLALITRDASELADFDAAAEWLGMPDYDPADETYKVVMSFTSNEDRHRFLDTFKLWGTRTKGGAEERAVFSGVWPIPDEIRNDGALRYVQATAESADAASA